MKNLIFCTLSLFVSLTAQAGTYNLTDLLFLPDTVVIDGANVDISGQLEELKSNIENMYAPDIWNERIWLNHYYRTNPGIFKAIVKEKLTDQQKIFDLIKSFAKKKLNDPGMIAAIDDYTNSSSILNRALWQQKSFLLDNPAGLKAADLGVKPEELQAALNIKKAAEALKHPAPKAPWILFRGTALKMDYLYDLVQQRLKGGKVIFPHYGFGSYSADYSVSFRFTLGQLSTATEIATVMEAMKEPQLQKAKDKIKALGYDWNSLTMPTLIARLTTQSMSILMDSWSQAPGELEAIQPPENIEIKDMFSLADHCLVHEGQKVPGMEEKITTPLGEDTTIPEAVNEFGILVLSATDMNSVDQLKLDVQGMSRLCTMRAYIRPSM